MPDDYIDPVGDVPPARPVEGSGAARREHVEHHATYAGEVVAVHRRTGHRDEGRHLLDASVGAQPHNELVIRVEGGDAELADLVGQRVSITVRA